MQTKEKIAVEREELAVTIISTLWATKLLHNKTELVPRK